MWNKSRTSAGHDQRSGARRGARRARSVDDKIFIASAFWRSSLDSREAVTVEPTPWSLSDQLNTALTLGDLAFLMLAVSDNAATNAIPH